MRRLVTWSSISHLCVLVYFFLFSESLGGYVYADMSISSVGAGSFGDLRFTTDMATATCLQACYHIVGKHVSHCSLYINLKRRVAIGITI